LTFLLLYDIIYIEKRKREREGNGTALVKKYFSDPLRRHNGEHWLNP
jgi:hypothetical protein